MGRGHGYFLNSLNDSSVAGDENHCRNESWLCSRTLLSPAPSGRSVYFPSCPFIPVVESEVGALASLTVAPSLKKLLSFWRFCPVNTLGALIHRPHFYTIFQRLSSIKHTVLLLVPSTVTTHGSVSVPTTTNPLLLSLFYPSSILSFPLTHLCTPPPHTRAS